MNPHDLPVYQQREKILAALAGHQVIVVESPTGSGKTTQLPIILHEAGFGRNGVIGVTQPRRIAALSVSDFIARQLGTRIPGLVGYKMRFEDRTDASTAIKIMTDGILLQEMKLDPSLSRYGVIMVDEAHERSLNIDFILGLLKRVLEARPEFKVIVSSATINAEVFSEYFGECPIVKIDTQVYPVTLIYDPPPASQEGDRGYSAGDEAMLDKLYSILERVLGEREDGETGDVLVFLPGERAIKEAMKRIAYSSLYPKIHLVPLYARLGKDEQERVFDPAPEGKVKVVLSTNIAETSVTIDGITVVIDSGLAKLNYYNPRTFTSSLIETPTSRASSNQRKGRAGRTRPGVCYRLFSRSEFEGRPLFTTEEIYRTDLSEVVLRMAELGITEFERFEFISRPAKSGLAGAVDALNLLDALEDDRSLSAVGRMMCEFPLLPRLSRMIVESITRFPDVLDETLIAAAFLSTMSPYILPPGEEMEARRAHHAFRDPAGDFVSYLRLYGGFRDAPVKSKWCERNYLDERTMNEIVRIREQLEIIISGMKIPVLGGGSHDDYLCAVSRGLIQFVCVRQDRGLFRSLTAEKIQIHPGSVMYRENPAYIVAGEVVRTTRMYAMSVSPLDEELLARISPRLAGGLGKAAKAVSGYGAYGGEGRPERAGRGRATAGAGEPRERTSRRAARAGVEGSGQPSAEGRMGRDFTNNIKIGNEVFGIRHDKAKRKEVVLEWQAFRRAREHLDRDSGEAFKGLRAVVTVGRYELMEGEKLETVLRIASWLDPENDMGRDWPNGRNFYAVPPDGEKAAGAAAGAGAGASHGAPDGAQHGGDGTEPGLSGKRGRKKKGKGDGSLYDLIDNLEHVFQVAKPKGKASALGFVALYTDGEGRYWFRTSRGFHTALNESLASLESLADALVPAAEPSNGDAKAAGAKVDPRVDTLYRRLSSFFD